MTRALISRLAVAAFIVATPVTANAGDVLIWSTGHQTSDDVTMASTQMATGKFTSVTGMDQLAPPSFAGYEAVLYFSNHDSAQDPVAIGDALATYLDNGGSLVICTFAYAQ